MTEKPTPQNVTVDTSLLNDAGRLRERADALDAARKGLPVDKYCEGEWIELTEISAFFYDRRYRARPSAGRAAAEGSADETGESQSGAGSPSGKLCDGAPEASKLRAPFKRHSQQRLVVFFTFDLPSASDR